MQNIILVILLPNVGCKNHYNDMITWTESIPQNSSIAWVKEHQPDYLEIDWDNPDVLDSFQLYTIRKINWTYDPLHMLNRLAFVENRYHGRWAHK